MMAFFLSRIRTIGLSIILLGAMSSLFAQDTLNLSQAISEDKITTEIRGNGGYSTDGIHVEITAKEKLVVHIPAGWVFPSEDPDEQDLIVLDDTFLPVKSGKTVETSLQTMCTQANNMSPDEGSLFKVGALATGKLAILAGFLSQKRYRESPAQSAVWAVTSKRSLASIYSLDTTMAGDILRFTAALLGKPVPKLGQPRAHVITSFRTSLEALPQKEVLHARLVAEDAYGDTRITYFNQARLDPGFWQFKLGVNHTSDPNIDLWLRLYDGDSLIAERKVTPQDSITPVKDVRTSVKTNMFLTENTTVSVGVYDDKGRLYYYLSDNALLGRGAHRSTFIIGKNLPTEVPLFLEIHAEGDSVLARHPIDINKPPVTLHPKRTVKGIWEYSIDRKLTGAEMQVLDEKGELVRKMFQNSTLNPGKKRYNYTFSHRLGPDNVFTLRLVDGEGKTVIEKVHQD